MIKKSVHILSVLLLLMVQLNFLEYAAGLANNEAGMVLTESNSESAAQDGNENEQEIYEDHFLINQSALWIGDGKSQILRGRSDHKIRGLSVSLNSPPPEQVLVSA